MEPHEVLWNERRRHNEERIIDHTGMVIIVGAFFGWVSQKTGSLLGVTLAHGITNVLLYLVVPFLQLA